MNEQRRAAAETETLARRDVGRQTIALGQPPGQEVGRHDEADDQDRGHDDIDPDGQAARSWCGGRFGRGAA